MSRSTSDLVRDSRLQTTFESGDLTRHVFHISDPARGLRRHRVKEVWKNAKRIGIGSFGSVWLQRCIQGTDASRPDVRAVKEIAKPLEADGPQGDDEHLRVVDCTRELEAVAKFSHANVRQEQ